MNTDIRLSIGFWQHPKTKKTVKRLGLEGIRSLQVLWLWAATNKPDGLLSGMDWEDIELAADWQGEEEAFFTFCQGVWLDETPDGYVLHDWQEHNSWAAEADDRSDKARFSRLATVNRPAFESMKAAGVNAISKEEYEHLTTVRRPSRERQTNADAPPTPAPSPSPSRKKQEKSTTPKGITENEGCARDSEPPSGGGVVKRQDSIPDFRGEPGIEFLELREYYDQHARPEGKQAGFSEYKQLRASTSWPGKDALYDGIDRLKVEDGEWQRGFAPGLAKFLRERVWEKEPVPPKALDAPRATTQHQADRQNLQNIAAMVLKADMEDLSNGGTRDDSKRAWTYGNVVASPAGRRGVARLGDVLGGAVPGLER